MRVSSSGASAGNKYLDFGGNFFQLWTQRIVPGITQQYPIGHGLKIRQKHRKQVSSISSFPATNEKEKNIELWSLTEIISIEDNFRAQL